MKLSNAEPSNLPCTQNPEAWFPFPRPDGSESPLARQAKQMCDTCPVFWSCREWGLNMGEPFGIWGGLSEQDRKAIWQSSSLYAGRPRHLDDSIDSLVGKLWNRRKKEQEAAA